MSQVDILLLAASLALDAAAASIVQASMRKAPFVRWLPMAILFSGFQMIMPVIGFGLATVFVSSVAAYGRWVACFVLVGIGGRMIYESIMPGDAREAQAEKGIMRHWHLLVILAVATSIDALAAGVTFAFVPVNIMQAVLVIGLVTFVLVSLAIVIGTRYGRLFGDNIEVIGGIILVFLGMKTIL